MIDFLFNLPRWQKRLIIMSIDLLILPMMIWIGFALRYSSWMPPFEEGVWLVPLAPIITIPIFIRLGLYRAIIRFTSDQQAITAVIKGITFSTIILAALTFLMQWQIVPRTVFPIYWGAAFIFIGGSRYLIRLIYLKRMHLQNGQRVLVYGAGEAGAQLVNTIGRNPNYCVVAFLDDNPGLWTSTIQGLPIHTPTAIPKLLEYFEIEKIFLAIPSVSKKRKSEILATLEEFPIHVLSIPRLSELTLGEKRIDDVREIEIDELLGRDPVTPDPELLKACISGLNVIVTGAGGSIGSELCRQIILLKPEKLILFDSSEYALYTIERELVKLINQHKLPNHQSSIIPVLGSVQNQDKVLETLYHHDIDTLYHAAAYKHVPLVEQNPLEGVTNNTFGTLRTALAAQAVGIKYFVLISTDKAVRPTNIMGASKRMAELALQGIAQQSESTRFSIVRFGNVLGSSGSVVPLFRKQIATNGPVTITHPDIIRYFMTIPEAATLVIQAGAMARDGEIFLLDMGEPVKIIDLAKQMIHLAGRTIRDDNNPTGDIAIKVSGLRPGEKLYEELLIDSHTQKTQHPKIFQANENFLEWPELTTALDSLEEACEQRSTQAVQKILEKCVQGFQGKIKTINQTTYSSKLKPIKNNVSFLPR